MVDGETEVFNFVMIKPSHYDDDGYPIQWVRSISPSNSLAVLHGLASDCAARKVLGPNVTMRLTPIDESNSRIRVDRIAAKIRREGGKALIGLVGVQSNQYPRALDLARLFRAKGLPVCIGGFHVSGCLSMLSELTPELQEALDLGCTLFAGEAEGRLEEVLKDAFDGRMPPIYNYLNDLPGLESEALPLLPANHIRRTAGYLTSFDAGRGCPYQCSFCTIINVQGRKSRFRSADDIEKITRANIAQGIKRFFITDDNFARNGNWEAIFDRLIELRETEFPKIQIVIQVDTLCHQIPNFIEKAGRAGVRYVFIGLESINPEALTAAKKNQNKITEYRKMLHAWRAVKVLTYAGYIIGFPTDTPESIVRDIKIIQRELPVDLLEFYNLTPLPGSEDHKKLHERGVWMNPDLNIYDNTHVTTHHPLMTDEEWKQAYDLAWETYYSPEHVETLARRAWVDNTGMSKLFGLAMYFYGTVTLDGIHPLEAGWLRRKCRKDRRTGLPIENPLSFYSRSYLRRIYKLAKVLSWWWRYWRLRQELKADPNARTYSDLALKPVLEEEMDELDIYNVTEAAKASVTLKRKRQMLTEKHGV